MQTVPHVSIVLPARDAEGTLPSSLASIVRQTFQDWECIIVDDGSTDRTSDIATETARRDPRFHFVRRPRRGLIAALNQGLLHCRGSLIARMDADDLMHSDRLKAQVAALDRDATLAAVGCHVRLFPRRTMSARLREYEAWLNGLTSADDISRDAFVECPVAHPSLTMRRAMAELGYVDSGWPEDYDLILRALVRGLRVGVVPRRLLNWRDRVDGLCRTDERYAQDRFVACKAHYLSAGWLSESRSYILWGYGGTGRSLRGALARLGRVPSHIVEVKATRIGQMIHGARVIAPAALRLLDRREPIIVSVARLAPRTEIRAALQDMGFIEGKDYVCAA